MSEEKVGPPDAPMTVQEAGRRGGAAVSKKYGREFFSRTGKAGGEATKAKHGMEFFEKIGKLGGRKGGFATRDKYGSDFYHTIGAKGGEKVKRIMAAAKVVEDAEKAAAEGFN